MKEITKNYINNFIENWKVLEPLKTEFNKSIVTLAECAVNNKILVCGNGGSAADSEHIAGELLKSFNLKRPVKDQLKKELEQNFGEDGKVIGEGIQEGVKCIPLVSFSGFSTAFLNDCNPNLMFAQLVNVFGCKNDVLIAISTSGNSKNVVYAAQMAKTLGMKVIALTGQSGGKLKSISDITLNVPSNIVYKIQEMHLPIYHLLCLCIESELYDL